MSYIERIEKEGKGDSVDRGNKEGSNKVTGRKREENEGDGKLHRRSK